MDDFPVLKAFQQYIDSEQAKARKRMLMLCIFFGALMVIVISVFLMLLLNVSSRNQSLNDRLVEYAMKERERMSTPIVVQQPQHQQDNSAILALTAKIEDLQKKLGHQVFEHGTRPAGETPVTVLLELCAAESPPVLYRHVALGDGKEAREHGLACHQIVISAGAPAFNGVVANVKKPSVAVVQRGEIHPSHERIDPAREDFFVQLQHGLPCDEEAGVQIAAVHRGDERRAQSQKSLRIVPVIEMPHAAGHFFKSIHDPPGKTHAFPRVDQAHIHSRYRGGKSKADIGGRGAVSEPHRGLFLKIIRRKPVVLRSAELGEILPCLFSCPEKKGPVLTGQGSVSVRR